MLRIYELFKLAERTHAFGCDAPSGRNFSACGLKLSGERFNIFTIVTSH